MSINVIRKTSSRFGVILPHAALNDSRLSFRDLGVLICLLNSKDGDSLASEDLAAQSDSREGREAVKKCLRNLEETGYTKTTVSRDQRGCVKTHRTVYDTTQLPTSLHGNHEAPPTPENPYAGSPNVGSPGAKSKSSTSKSNSLSCNAPARGSAKKKPTLMLGICCWNTRDEQRVSALRNQHGDEALTAAVAGWKPPTASGHASSQRTSPLPSEVEKILKSSTGVHDGSRQQSNSASDAGNLLAYYLDYADEHEQAA